MSESELQAAARLAAEGDVEAVRSIADRACAELVDDHERLRWCLILAEVGDIDRARALAAPISKPDLRLEIEAVLRPHDGVDVEIESMDELFEHDGSEPGTELVELFLRWFGGRRDLYARQWYSDRRKRGGYRPVREPLTREVARAHLSGRITIGQYLLFGDATVSYAVIDLDLAAGAMEVVHATHGIGASPLLHAPLRRYGVRLIETAARLGLAVHPEESGGRGLHLWFLFEPRKPARVARSVLGQVLESAGPQPADVAVEIFPKQEVGGPRGLSSLVKLPLGVHQTTMRRCPLLDGRLEPLEPLDALRGLRALDAGAVDAIVGRRVALLPPPELEPRPGLPALPTAITARNLAEAMKQVGSELGEGEAARRIIDGCSIVARLVRKAYDERKLEPDEARAIVYTIGLLGPEPSTARQALLAAGASVKELARVQGGMPSPAGCRRLRQVAPDVVCDACPGPAGVPYASPCFFAVGGVPAAPPRHLPFSPWLAQSDDVLASPFDVLGSALERIEARLDRLESRPPGGPGEDGTE
jgi:hypothetical protein